jgi:hypothetical protein
LSAAGARPQIWIWGATVICTRQKATGTGGPGGKPGNGGGSENVLAAIEVAVIDVTSGKTRLDKLSHVPAAAGVAAMPTPASAMAAKPAILGANVMMFSPSQGASFFARLALACGGETFRRDAAGVR